MFCTSNTRENTPGLLGNSISYQNYIKTPLIGFFNIKNKLQLFPLSLVYTQVIKIISYTHSQSVIKPQVFLSIYSAYLAPENG